MNRKTCPEQGRRIILGLFVLVAFVFLALNVRVGYAEPSVAPRTGGYEISWYTIDGGGAQNLTGGTYSLSGTIGQYDAGTASGGSYTLAGGFWNTLTDVVYNYKLNLPLVVR
jgi:hypothetical protein